MSIQAVSAIALPEQETESAMLLALRSILRNGALCIDQAETLAAAATDSSIDEATRCFAGQSLRWLAQQSGMVMTSIWQPNNDARN